GSRPCGRPAAGHRQRGKQSGTRRVSSGTGTSELCFGGSNRLIGNVDLRFEGIQLRVAKYLPPIAPNSVVLRRRLLPFAVVFEVSRRRFFESGRHGCCRRFVFRADGAGGEQEET